VVGLWVVTAIQVPNSKGIIVHALPAVTYRSSFDSWTEPIVIRVDAEHRYYLNFRLIAIENLPSALTQMFRTRANWTVYIEGDLEATYGDVVQAADAVRTAHGRVVLLTATVGGMR
jgi:biopolymer transport protein ExbD